MLSHKASLEWPELRFPPINLWVIAALPQAEPIAHAQQQRRVKFEGDARLHTRLQNKQQQNRQRMQHLLAAR